MECAAILGVYEYLGYSLCQYMLDKGIEVEGIHFGKRQEHYFIEEKRLEIGRNANFSEIIFQDWNASSLGDILFISLYEEESLKKVFIEKLMKKVENINLNNQRIILILPAYLAKKHIVNEGWQQNLISFFEKKQCIVVEVYLPTIYGPWQPEEFFFQQALHFEAGENEMIQLGDWEWTHDAIYSEDAVNMIMKTVEAQKKGKFFLTSGENNQWLNCAKVLLGNRLEHHVRKSYGVPEIKETIQILKVKKNEDITKGLLKQKEQYCRIQESRL